MKTYFIVNKKGQLISIVKTDNLRALVIPEGGKYFSIDKIIPASEGYKYSFDKKSNKIVKDDKKQSFDGFISK